MDGANANDSEADADVSTVGCVVLLRLGSILGVGEGPFLRPGGQEVTLREAEED